MSTPQPDNAQYLSVTLLLERNFGNLFRSGDDHDDWTILVAWALALVNNILVHFYVVAIFAGYRPQDIPMAEFLARQAYAAKLQYAFAIQYNSVMCAVKLSFVWSLQRLQSSNKYIAVSLWTIQALNLTYGIVGTLLNAFPCNPLAKHFDSSIPGRCIDPFKLVIGCISSVLITDLMVLVMPTWIIYDLKMSLRRRVLSIAFLSMGGIVIVVGVLRAIWLTNIFKGVYVSYSVESAYSSIEANVAIIGASGPTVKYIFGIVCPCLRSRDGERSTPKGSGAGQGYGSASTAAAGPRPSRLSKYQGRSGYNDLSDSDSMHRREEGIEMDKGIGNRRFRGGEGDVRTDERRMGGFGFMTDGIVKTVDWSVSSVQDSTRRGSSVGPSRSTEGGAVLPANVI
ncbi:hypothetical protein DM02DRAFT_653523 [Periconia macrospinosa]|uniref:Rhodopsin domain-containing protein n=1 Tax=Periconia macrospinosa TaxID=97972 RepID=A0A2V1DYV4_9PLEO|nr:hypothetical protein DM02DRAFT_653523 [Periconia macrospinosa]